MASGVNMVELKTQEIVFLGNMFVDPKEMNQYGSVIETHELISTEPAKSIWKKMYTHYTKYGELPPDELMDNVFSDKELENLRLGIAIAGSEASRAMFILDQFIGTMHSMLYKRFMAALEKMFDSGNADIDNANDLMKKLSEDLLTIRHLSGASVQSMGSIWESWSKGELMTQAPRIPIPIKGLEFVQGTPPSAVNVLIGHYGGGKEQPKSLVIPTPTGNRVWGSLRPGDYVFGRNGKPTRVLEVFDNGVKDIYRVTFDDGTSTLCGAEHLWTVRGRAARRYDREHGLEQPTWQTLTTTELLKKRIKLPHGKCSPLRQWELPKIDPVEYTQKDLPVHPYIMGMWLGDGCRTNLDINSTHTEVIHKIRELADVSVHHNKSRPGSKTIVVHGLRRHLESLGLWGHKSSTKFIPQIYLEASIEDRLELFRGLMDSDGECKQEGQLCFGSTSKALVDGMGFLIRSLGGKARTNRKVKKTFYRDKQGNKVPCKDFYRVSIAMPSGVVPFLSVPKRAERYNGISEERYLTRWIDSIELTETKEECMCITVEAEDGLYLTNDFIVTHNTSTLCAMASQLSTTCNVLYVTLEMPAESIAFRILACQSQGKIQANHVFMNPNTWGDNEVQPVIKKAKEVINGEHSIYFIDAPATTASPAQLDVYLKNFKNRYGLDVDVVIIDYAALMVTNSGASREDIGWGYTGVIIKELTAVAKKHGLVIWVAAQAGGESAHTVTSANSSSFKPLRGNQLYGSKEVLQDASYVLGLSFMRSSEFPHLAVGVLSTIKNRYGSEFYDYICSMDYSTASFESLGIAPGGSEGDLISLVEQHLRSMEQEFAVKNQLQNKQKVQSLKSLYYNANKSATSCGTAGLVKPKAPKPSYLQKPKASSKQQDSREESY